MNGRKVKDVIDILSLCVLLPYHNIVHPTQHTEAREPDDLVCRGEEVEVYDGPVCVVLAVVEEDQRSSIVMLESTKLLSSIASQTLSVVGYSPHTTRDSVQGLETKLDGRYS